MNATQDARQRLDRLQTAESGKKISNGRQCADATGLVRGLGVNLQPKRVEVRCA